MNTTRLAKIAEWLEAGGWDGVRGFDIRESLAFSKMDPCSPRDYLSQEDHYCAIEGAAVSLFGDIENVASTCKESPDGGWIADEWAVIVEAASVLGLDIDTAVALFLPARRINYSGQITRSVNIDTYNDPAWAARVIRKLIAVGVVDWPGCAENPTNGN